MCAKDGGTVLDREGTALQRVLAAVLFALAAIIGLPAILAATVALRTLEGPALAVLVVAGAIAWTVAWLGRILWTGRPIPRWFLASFLAFLSFAPAVLLLAEREWLGASVLLAMGVASSIANRSAVFGYAKTPALGRGLQDLD